MGRGTGKPVEQEAKALANALPDHRDDQVVGHEAPIGHVRRRFAAEFCASRSMVAQELTGGDVSQPELLPQLRGLRTFAHAGRSDEHEPKSGDLRG